MDLSMDTVTTWITAMKFADEKNYEQSLQTFQRINSKSSKILYNMGCISALLDNQSQAIEYFSEALSKDNRSVVALLQRANIFYALNRISECENDLLMALNFLPELCLISYQSGQFGLRVKVSTCQVLHNLSLCYWFSGSYEKAQSQLVDAKKCSCKVQGRHKFIDDTLTAMQSGENLKPVRISYDRLFRPAKAIISSTKDIDYLERDKTKIIAAHSPDDRITGFIGPHIRSLTPPLSRRQPLPRTNETVRSITPPPIRLRPPPPPRPRSSPSPVSNEQKSAPVSKNCDLSASKNKPRMTVHSGVESLAAAFENKSRLNKKPDDSSMNFRKVIDKEHLHGPNLPTFWNNDFKRDSSSISSRSVVTNSDLLSPPTRIPPRAPVHLRKT
ncbi:neutrophil cytosol factor 2-like [Tubulanus polymorphus]|uniref:neutrophil cytosol factor 2-like n=1 Tax=Tubulanus polymorphus TaxID=672921 RepID=UPI003DA55CA0